MTLEIPPWKEIRTHYLELVVGEYSGRICPETFNWTIHQFKGWGNGEWIIKRGKASNMDEAVEDVERYFRTIVSKWK